MQKVALIGNPNCGKTTIFNLLTGANQKVGNWPGVTVEKKIGFFKISGQEAELVDLPGIYSLEQEYRGIDEGIALDYLNSGHIDLIINIIDATNLERSLVLTQQLLEKSIPVLIALNMMDVAEQQGVSVSAEKLADRLEIPVVPITASKNLGITELSSTIHTIGLSLGVKTSELSVNDNEEVEEKILK